VDNDFPWDETAARSVRYEQYRDALAAEPAKYGPFKKEAWASHLPLGFFPDPCITSRWNSQPPYPKGTHVAGIPTLVLTGDYDLSVPTAESQRAGDVLTDSTLIDVKTAGHNPWFWRDCATRIVQRFIRSEHAVDLCASDPQTPVWEIGGFPRWALHAPPAHQRDGDESRFADRRLVTIGVWTVLDVIHRSYASSALTGRGLRGGKTSLEVGDFPTPDVFNLDNVRFTDDVTVNGTGFADWEGNYGGDITLQWRHGVHGVMHFKGAWYNPDADVFVVRGHINGRSLRLAVPAR
jgi:hypothetical protein